MFVYFSAAQLKSEDFRGPDFFAVLGVPKAERKSWVVWQEGKAPDVVIELLSWFCCTSFSKIRPSWPEICSDLPRLIWGLGTK